tara:strand:- start:93 stop:542 length:450 start_codon:yes stop_codon:yes gene_type:complete
MLDKDGLISLLEPVVIALGYELVDLDAHTGGRGTIRVYIDREQGIMLSDCEFLSHQLSAFLDVEGPFSGNYILEVSSPGIDRKLRTLEHFQQFKGQEIRVELSRARNGHKRLKGALIGVKGEQILLELDGDLISLHLSDIHAARLVPQF